MERRELIKKVFVYPIILTLAVTPSMARSGSDWTDDDQPAPRETTYKVVTPGGYYGDPNAQGGFYSAGTWQIMPDGKVYLLEPNTNPAWGPAPLWHYIGMFGTVAFPQGFPLLTLNPTSPIFVVPN